MAETDIDLAEVEKEARIVNKYRDDLLSGRTLALHAQSHRSRYGYKPPIGRRDWAHAVRTLADMAASSDRMAQVAVGIIGHLNLYGDDAQLCAAMYEHAAQVMRVPFDDVIGRAGPEPGRYSDHQHAWTLYDRVAVHYWLELACRPCAACAPGVGWCLQIVARMVGFHPTPAMDTTR